MESRITSRTRRWRWVRPSPSAPRSGNERTVAVSVPLHTRLGEAYDDGVARRLVATNWLRTAAWTAGTLCAAALVLQAA